MQLLYVPDEQGPTFFLWGLLPTRQLSPTVRTLKRYGRRATTTVVTESLGLADVAGVAVPVGWAIPTLAAAATNPALEVPAVAAWAAATRIALELVERGYIVPRCEASAGDNAVARWRVHLRDARDVARVNALADAMPYAAFALPATGATQRAGAGVTVYAARAMLRHFLDAAADAVVRDAVVRDAGVADRRASRASIPPPDDLTWSSRWTSALAERRGTFAVALPHHMSVLRMVNAWSDAVSVPATGAPLRVTLRMRIGAAPVASSAGAVRPVRRASGSGRGAGSLGDVFEFRWEAAVGDTSLTEAELRELAESKTPLIAWRGRWLIADPERMRTIRELVGRGGTLSPVEALRAALSGEPACVPDGIGVAGSHRTRPLYAGEHPLAAGVVADRALVALLARVEEAGGRGVPVDLSAFSGTLRPYQERGVRWLATMGELGLGGCLADDMGLGKTVQILALLLHTRATCRDARPSLIVCPTSVAGNWEREAARFAPSLRVLPHYGTGRARRVEALGMLDGDTVVVTTYPVLRQDAALFRAVEWRTMVLDEAQHIKNAAAKVSAVVRTLRAERRFALTGTPVENRLGDLWAILDATTPGLLGSTSAFTRQYVTPIEKRGDDAAAGRLRRVVSPFVLRRVKADPTIAADLPPKQETDVLCHLTREQAALYRAAVDDALETIETSTGIARKGNVLALITALKQICNDPAQYLREETHRSDGSVRSGCPERSGKLARLTEMLEEVVAERDKALVFTQFRDMGDRLLHHLRTRLDSEVQFLHGGASHQGRQALVDRFQREDDEPLVFILSLTAGGTGLNLTAAGEVFHFDRWWNPAVEDQATDRAHRIGQTRPVQVYKFVTAGTIEEKIAAMIQNKRTLSQRVVGVGERWITELGTAELRELLTLSETVE